MAADEDLQLVLLHALPLDGSMWAGQQKVLPGATYAPTLYALGNSMEEWAEAVLGQASSERLLVVGCSVGGSCAIELAFAAPERVAALVLVGTKVEHRPEPELRARAVRILEDAGVENAWQIFWEPLLGPQVDRAIRENARQIAMLQSPGDLCNGVTVFHTRPSRAEFLYSFPRPVIFVTGEYDVAPGPETTAAQAAMARLGRIYMMPGCGHYVPLESPEPFNAILSAVVEGLR